MAEQTWRARSRDAKRGVELSNALLRAVAARDERHLLDLVNRSDTAAVRWAAARLTAFAWEMAVLGCRGDTERAAAALQAASEDHVDSLVTQAMVVANEGRVSGQ